ncbi:hypothetical protein [Micavibrio aeruginosavorus]|nr:hypothetical protein [Micavibrio aeruginosavorus]
MTKLSQTFRLVLIIPPLLSMLLLTGCGRTVVVNDPAEQCHHPALPERPYTDQKRAILVLRQAEAIDKCRSLLGHTPTG